MGGEEVMDTVTRAPAGIDRLYVVTAFTIQLALVAHFALRTWAFDSAVQVGWVVYALAIPVLVVSTVLLRAGQPWYEWAAGYVYALWAAFGYLVDYASPVEWRSPIVWPVFLPYVGMYLAAQMLYWWPLARFDRRLWVAYAALFAISTGLNLASHR
jgi:hypothetical protein